MSEPAKQFDVNSDPCLSNAGVTGGVVNPSFRDAVPSTSTALMAPSPPILPPRPDLNLQQTNYGLNPYSYGGMGMGGMSMGGYGGYGYGGGGGYGGYGMGGMGGYGAMGGMYNGFNRPMYGDIESRFIQMAEDSSRPAFDSIQSLVSAVGSVAMMLENTFFALTSSFRAILGVAENFGRLRSLFAQFWSTFAVLRTINWIIRKLMVILGIRTETEFKAWAEAVASTQNTNVPPEQRKSSWPVLLFFAIVAAAPYIVFRMLNGLTNSINERLNDPTTWQNPFRAIAQHNFQGSSSQELSFSTNQVLFVAPQHLQGNMWNSGWLMASTDRQHAGLVPVNYIKLIRPNQTDNQNQNNVTVCQEKEEDKMADLEKFYGQEL